MIKISQMHKYKIHFNFTAIAIGWFIFLCLLHYLSRRPLWLDEISVLKNIQELSFLKLFGFLNYGQVFPRVYLAGIKFFSQYFNFSLLSLRLLPLVFMLAGFFIWFKIYRIEALSKLELTLSLGLFSSAYFISHYSSELKQYSADLFVIGAFTLFIYYQRNYALKQGPVKLLFLFSLILPFLIFLSYVSILIAWIPLYNYLLLLKKDKRVFWPFLSFFLIMGLSYWVMYSIDIKYTLDHKHSPFAYWSDYFISTASLGDFFKTSTEGVRSITVRWFLDKKIAREVATIFLPFCWVAIFKNFKASVLRYKAKILDINSLCLILILELFILGLLKIYPFTGERVTLFIAPFIFYMIVKGIYLIKGIRPIFYPMLGIYILFIPLISGYSLSNYIGLYFVKETPVKEAPVILQEEKMAQAVILYQAEHIIDFNTFSGPSRVPGGPEVGILRIEF